MIVVTPIEVTTSNLTSNVAISETAWSAGTYSTGTRRYVGTDLYEVVATPSTSAEPTAGAAANPPTWINVGKINQFKMFATDFSQSTSNASLIEVTIEPDALVNAVGVFEVTGAATVQVEVDDPVEGLAYDKTVAMRDQGTVVDLYTYFFEPIIEARQALFLDLPNLRAAAITITITGSGTVTVAECVLGRQQSLGVTTQDVSVSIEDFSRPERDEFGRFTGILRRRFARLMNATVFVQSLSQDAVLRNLAELRVTPCVFIGGEDFLETYIYGIYREFIIARTGPTTSEMRIEIEGIV